MNAPRTLRAITGICLLAPVLAMADGVEPAAPRIQPVPGQDAVFPQQGGMPPMPMWPQQMMPAMGAHPYYGGLPPGMMLPAPSPSLPALPAQGMAAPVGAELGATPAQPVPMQGFPGMPGAGIQSMPMWPQQMMPSMGMQPVYGGMPPGMMWPMQSPYPAPMMPPAPQVIWVPYMWVMMPAQAGLPPGEESQSAAHPPVAGLPALDAMPSTPSAEPVPPAPVVKADPAPPVPAARLPQDDPQPAAAGPFPVPAAMDSPLPETPLHESSVAAVVPVPAHAAGSKMSVDYGPVAPTPVVVLPAGETQRPSVPSRKRSRAGSRDTVKSAVPKARQTSTKATAKPAKPRMCWTRGVVAPCR